MFSNIGGKIKRLATAICVVGIGVSVLCGMIIIASGAMLGMGFAILIGGSLLLWIGSFFAYGFGELIEDTTVIAELAAKADAEKSKAE